MPNIELRFNRDVLVCEGAMGTMLQRQGMAVGACPTELNVLDPEMVLEVHKYYLLAGSQCAITNTFGGTRAKLEEYGLGDRVAELNMAGVVIARQQHPEHVLADVGPCGLLMEPIGEATFEQVFAQYFEQVTALAKGKPDAILIETMIDIADARCAVLAARYACDLPILVTCTFNESGRMPLSGTDPATAALILEAAGAHAVGLNCGLGPQATYPLLCDMAAATSLPLIVQPNAGMPALDAQGETIYPGTPDEMAIWAEKFRAAGAQIIGSCCGSTPAFTSAIAAVVSGLPVVPHGPQRAEANEGSHTVTLCGPRQSVIIGGDHDAIIIGECINPSNKPTLAGELCELEMDELVDLAFDQTDEGAALLDVNLCAEGVDEVAAFPVAVNSLIASCATPLVFDTQDAEALEKALRVYPGRALVNSCSGNPASYEAILPIVKQYGAAVVLLAMDEKGVPATVEERLAVIERLWQVAKSYGLRDEDLLVDVLSLSSLHDVHAPELTLEALKGAHARGYNTILGISNASFGLGMRASVNAAFAYAAVLSGLDVAIANPLDSELCDAIARGNEDRAQAAEKLPQALTLLRDAISLAHEKA